MTRSNLVTGSYFITSDRDDDMSDHSRDTLPLVVLRRVPLLPSRIQLLARVSRTVAAWNGNRLGQYQIYLITDDFTLAHQALRAGDQHRASRNVAQDNLGVFWPSSGVMWLNPITRAQSEHVRTLAHETAHALTVGEHSQRWRRMYSLLLPLWWHALCPASTIVNLESEICRVVDHYAARRMTLDAREHEIAGHVRAGWRAYNRWSKVIDDQIN